MLKGVVFDFHNTVVRADSLTSWVTDAVDAIGTPQPANTEIIRVRLQWSDYAARGMTSLA